VIRGRPAGRMDQTISRGQSASGRRSRFQEENRFAHAQNVGHTKSGCSHAVEAIRLLLSSRRSLDRQPESGKVREPLDGPDPVRVISLGRRLSPKRVASSSQRLAEHCSHPIPSSMFFSRRDTAASQVVFHVEHSIVTQDR
jgi:hypothetical protein